MNTKTLQDGLKMAKITAQYTSLNIFTTLKVHLKLAFLLEQHGGAVVITVDSQQEGSGL